MMEDLETEFYAKVAEVEAMRSRGIKSREEAKAVKDLEVELLKLEEDMECMYTLEEACGDSI